MDIISMLPETPAVLIDKEQTRKNSLNIAKEINKYGVNYRPHSKTHKSVEYSRLQIECGAVGICCAKISEAEVMADGGIKDIFIAYPVIGDFRIKKAAELAKRIRLILTVDSAEGAKMLSDWGVRLDTEFEVRMEIDTQFNRTGVRREHAVELAKYIASLPNLKLTGISTFRSLTYNGEETTNARLAGVQEGEMMVETAEKIRAAGIPIKELSGGSSPTGKYVASVKGVTEVRTGTNIFNDYNCITEGACGREDISAWLVMTVVSTPVPDYAVVDGGTKAFATDFPVTGPTGKPEYAYGRDDPDLVLNRMYEEHGIIVKRDGSPTNLKVGDRIALIPAHICSTINLYNYVFTYENGTIHKTYIDGRGKLL
jgi:D-serine deaminase-like pyridoxal phosphate-dependent protein